MNQHRLELSSNIAVLPSKVSLSEQIARDTARYSGPITVLETKPYNPYRETPRKKHPEWQAAAAQRTKDREKKTSTPKGMYSNRDVMEIYGFDPNYGNRDLIAGIENGEIPEPDLIRSAGRNSFFRFWWKGKINQHVALHAIAERHCE